MISATDHTIETNRDFVIAVDLGGTHLRAALIDDRGTVDYRLKLKTPTAGTADAIVSALLTAARECADRCQTAAEVRAISIAVPGTVNTNTGSVVQMPKFLSLEQFPLAEILSKELGHPAILENDANAAAVGEMWLGAARGRQSFVCLTLGTGVGAGIILEGKLWRGANGSAAEIGHTCVDPFAGDACNCGSRGCLELYASATAIVRMAREARARYPNSALPGNREFTAEDVYSAGVQGDELAIEVFGRMGDYLGVGLANLMSVLNPEMIVIGGGAADGWDLFAEAMNRRIAERTFPLSAMQIPVVRAECGDDAGLLGAARLGFDYLSRS